MSIWDDISDLFKSQDQLDKEFNQKVNSAKEQEKELLKKLKEFEEQYKSTLPEKEEKDYYKLIGEFEKKEKEDNTLSNDELEDMAHDKAYADYEDMVNKIKEKYDIDIDNTASGKNKIEADGIEKLKELKEYFEKSANAINNKMSRKGLYNSSIKDNLSLKNVMDYDDNTKDAIKSTQDKLQNIDDKIKELEKNKEQALEDFDVKTAKNYTKELESLITARDKERQKIKQYNEELAQERTKFNNNREKQIQAMRENDAKAEREKQRYEAEQEKLYGYQGEKKDSYDKRLEVAVDFYNTLPKDVAISVIKSNPSLKHYLGNYYYSLLDAMESRREKKSPFSNR